MSPGAVGVVEHAGGGIAYAVTGEPATSPVLFAHSLGLDRSSWDSQVASLSSAFRTVQIDLRGHGASGAPPGPYGLEDLASDVLAVADALAVQQFHFVGLSISGMVAQYLGIHHRDRLRSLTICNTAPRIGTPEFWQERIDAIRDGGMAAISEAVTARFFSEGFGDMAPDVYDAARSTLEATDPDGYIGCCQAVAAADLRREIGGITTPSLVIGGREDLATPPEQAELIHQAVAGSRLVILDGAGHVSNLEQPGAFTAALADFLRFS
ncbi:MAG: 3-oxoadipate enol-lactonase [Acidimicrobiia bacterium]|nr:3-oxoadipate enol-lactonase [Acidimicrobiia bacterium]